MASNRRAPSLLGELLEAAPTPFEGRALDLAGELIRQAATSRTIQAISELCAEAKTFPESLDASRCVFGHAPIRRPPDLPPEYGFKGGVARYELAQCLGERAYPEPRDVDLIRFGRSKSRTDDETARRFMPEDFARGANIELIGSEPRYFPSRDLTLNEVYVTREKIVVSPIGLLDTMSRTLRPTRYRSGTLHSKASLPGKIVLKALRFHAELSPHGLSKRIVGIPEQIEFSEFDLLLQLERALDRGQSVGELFVRLCGEVGILYLPEDGDPLQFVAKELEHLVQGDTVNFSRIRTILETC